MAQLSFDATEHPSEPGYGLVLGRSRSHLRWDDRRTLSWSDLAELLAPSSPPPPGPKDGPCFVPASFRGVRRVKSEAQRIDMLCLDSDTGQDAGALVIRLRELGWAALIHSTHSHLVTTTQVAAEPFDAWAKTLQAGQASAEAWMMRQGYAWQVARAAEVTGDQELPSGPGKTTRYYTITHQPCPKYRVVLPLAAPWLAADYPSQDAANAVWRERIGAVAYALKLHHDQSCVDPSRLFYLPRRRAADAAWEAHRIDGAPCPMWELQDVPSPGLFSLAGPQREAAAEFQPRPAHAQQHQPGAKMAEVADSHGEVIDLVPWAARFADRFEVVTALRARRPEVFGPRRGSSGTKWHIECPNAAGHMTDQTSRTGTYCVNASQLAKSDLPGRTSGFAILCSHSGCAGRDRLDHLGAMLRQGWLSVADLTDEAYLVAGKELIDASAMIQAGQAKRQAGAAPAPGTYEDPEDGLPWALCQGLPGVLGVAMDWVLATSPKPQPPLALGAIMATMGAALGQKVSLHDWGVRSNVYVVGTCKSGGGKERPMNAMKQWASAADQEKLIGAEEITSDTGIVNIAATQPAHVMLLDEVAYLLTAANAKAAAPYMAMVISTLLKFYSSTRTVYKGKQYADAEKVKVIDQPCISLYGCSTPDGFYDALSSKDVSSGLLSRLVLFSAGTHDPLGRRPAQIDVPQDAIDWLRAWGDVPAVRNPVSLVNGRPVIEPTEVTMTAEATAMAEAFEAEMHHAKQRAARRGMDSLYVRARENALKFAMIRACAVLPVELDSGKLVPDFDAIRVTAEDMRWACELSRATILLMDKTAASEIVDTSFEAQVKKIRKMVLAAGMDGLTTREMRRAPGGRLQQRAMDDVMVNLVEAREIFLVSNVRDGKPGRQRTAYVHRSFMQPEWLERLEGND